MKIIEFFLNYAGKMVRAGAGAVIFDMLELELEPEKMDRLRNFVILVLFPRLLLNNLDIGGL
jgi:hypothetical protein